MRTAPTRAAVARGVRLYPVAFPIAVADHSFFWINEPTGSRLSRRRDGLTRAGGGERADIASFAVSPPVFVEHR